MNCLQTRILFLVLFCRGPKPSRPHTLFLSVRGLWMDCLHFLLLFPVLSWRAQGTNCLRPWFPFRRSLSSSCLHFLSLSLRGVRTHPLHLLCLSGSAADLHGLAEGPSGLRTVPLSSTMGSPGPAASRQIIGSYIAGRLNSGSAGDGLRAVRLNSCLPSEAPSAHLGRMFVLFLFCGRLGSALKGRGYVIPACVFVILIGLVLCFLSPCTPSPHLFCFPLIVLLRLSLVPPAVQFLYLSPFVSFVPDWFLMLCYVYVRLLATLFVSCHG
ncbi:hypothetical protein AMECASPLE_032247 [Ameca splendens]|uniref:Uncharacterized protein n=1 Tax=Ameca splendens TaxID=208324 RepID=A0ABV0YUU4_9TELE